jgi:hypothetical protein
VLHWTIADATDHAGFNVAREDAEGTRVQLNQGLLTGGTEYTFVDPNPPATETRYWLAELSRTGATTWYGPTILAAGGIGAEPRLVLAQSVPNPMRAGAGTSIRFTTPRDGWVTIAIYDLSGRELTRLVDASLAGGAHEVLWNGLDAGGRPVGTGMYYYRVTTPNESISRKLVRLP